MSCDRPEGRLFGCDIDPRAFEFLSETLETHSNSKHFARQDFLKLRPADFAIPLFTVVVGNPPYVSYHSMSDAQRASVNTLIEASGLRLQNKPSLWAYFVIHSLQFLKQGGRCAWLLPSSFVFADYANEVRKLLKQHFSRSLILMLGERIFLSQGTEERTVVVLCEGYQTSGISGTMEMGFASDLDSLDSIIEKWNRRSWQGVDCNTRANLALMEGEPLLSYSELSASNESKLLGDLCKIKIGIVTGANSFFILNREQALSNGIPDEALSFILAKFSNIRGLKVLRKDMEKLYRSGGRCLLVDTRLVDNLGGALGEYLDGYSTEAREINKTFKKRKLWHRPNDGLIPDAFLSYMQASGPSLMLNVARIVCTNTIHRVFFNESVNSSLSKAIAISIMSTFSQLSAEIEGRSYGSGVLKHEPSEAYKIALLIPTVKSEVINNTFRKIHILLRQGLNYKAQAEADNFVLFNYSIRARRHHLSGLGRALIAARSRRQRHPE